MSDESNAVELYRKHRPSLWKHVYGQSAAIKCIEDMLKDGRIPHSMLFTGPSGCGKTTLARILKKKLNCADTDFTELNCAKERGIDMVRDISQSMTLSPLGGNCRIYLLDECFPAGTKVTTFQGLVDIQSVKVGDRVANLNGTGVVTATFKNKVELDRIVKLHFDDGSFLITTKQHEIFTEKGWVEAQNTQENHCIKDQTKRIRVDRVEVYEQGCNESSFVGAIGDREKNQGYAGFYDIEVSGHPSYFANGIPVHNCHRLTGDGMSSLLKMLEDTPKHVYFFLCTTDPRKLLKTILTRCTEIKLQPLGKDDLLGLLSHVCKLEKIELNTDLQEKIAEVADGSARMALVLLHQVIRIKDPKEQMELIEASDTSTKAWDIVKGLLWEKCTWTTMAGIINGIEGDDWEGLRRLILANATTTMLKGGKQAARAAAIANTFQYPWYDIGGKPGMILACYNVLSDK